MADDGKITFSVWLDADAAEKELASVKKKILDLEKELYSQQGKKTDLEASAEKAKLALEEAVALYSELRRAGASAADLKAQEKVIDLRGKEYDAAVAAVEKQNAAIADTTRRIETEKLAYGELAQQAAAAGDEGKKGADKTSSALEDLGKRVDRFSNRITGLIKRIFVFSLVTRALRSVREYFGAALKTSDEFTAATARLKAALLTAVQPIYSAVLPALTALINVLTHAMQMLASLSSSIFGTTATASAEAAESLYSEANALDAVGGAGGKAAKSLAGFDEINKLDSGSGGGGGGAAAGGLNTPDFKGMIEGQMSELEVYLSGALLALGAILTFTGASIPLGIGLMIVGAAGLASAASVNWDSIPPNVKKALTLTLAVLGGAALAIGAILTFSGHIPLGIGLMIAGAAALGSAVALNWNAISKALQGTLGGITALVSSALLAIGLILLCSGAALPLGLGLVIVGAAGLATSIAANWSAITSKLRGTLGVIVAIASAALLALGLILVCSGAALPLGIGLLIAGATGLAATVAANWSFITEKLKGTTGLIVAIASGALLALGLILVLSGAALPLGIGLLIAGGAGLATAVAANWDFILEKLRGAWGRIKAWWNTNIAPVFTKQWWQNLFSVIGDGMKAAVNAVLGAIESGLNWIIDKMNGLAFDVPQWVPQIGGKHFGFSISRVSIPRLAAGAVIPPNREFLAVLGDQPSGTNIEAPLDTIVAAFRQVMQETGGARREIVLEVDRQVFARIVLDLYNSESQRVGPQLGGAS